MLMTTHLKQNGLVPHQECSINKFRSYAAFQTHENYFRNATPLLERPVDQSSLHDTDIPKWFAHKDWN